MRDRGDLISRNDVIGVQDERKTSRSQEIDVNSFREELCSSERSGRPGITQDLISVQACSSEDSKSLNVEQTHDRSRLDPTNGNENWVRKLLDNQKGKLFDKPSFSNQPNQLQIQFVIDQGDLIT